ncbi:MAG: hypothetical protein HC881_24145, partial [Leptolyngbyaceae cyanobacterium SL_7_1]|nr:hypothetical protein [Leptolyngbyaceae cyanobacterium SL_7_1]
MNQSNAHPSTLTPLLAGGLMFAFISLLVDMRGAILPRAKATAHEACQGTVNSQVVISREQLAQ